MDLACLRGDVEARSRVHKLLLSSVPGTVTPAPDNASVLFHSRRRFPSSYPWVCILSGSPAAQRGVWSLVFQCVTRFLRLSPGTQKGVCSSVTHLSSRGPGSLGPVNGTKLICLSKGHCGELGCSLGGLGWFVWNSLLILAWFSFFMLLFQQRN